MSSKFGLSGEAEAIILVKAAPQVGTRNGETVCCAGLNLDLGWLRLYPIKFRRLDDNAKFRRWDRVRFSWRKPADDPRLESRRVIENSLEIIGQVSGDERHKFVSRAVVASLTKERADGRSLALIKPEFLRFSIERKPQIELEEERLRFEHQQRQMDLFAKTVAAYKPCPYLFRYRYRHEDKIHNHVCQDWEINATFFNHASRYGEAEALAFIQRTFGEEYPKKGMLFAMGTHSQRPDQWLLNGVIRYNEPEQGSLF